MLHLIQIGGNPQKIPGRPFVRNMKYIKKKLELIIFIEDRHIMRHKIIAVQKSQTETVKIADKEPAGMKTEIRCYSRFHLAGSSVRECYI